MKQDPASSIVVDITISSVVSCWLFIRTVEDVSQYSTSVCDSRRFR